MKNSKVWFEFLFRNYPSRQGFLSFAFRNAEHGIQHLEIRPGRDRKQDDFSIDFGVGVISNELVQENLKSGVPSESIESLDCDLREIREKSPGLPLICLAKPISEWPRSHSWGLGEFLAERDLPFWVDLTEWPEEKQAALAKSLVDCGLASARLAVQVGDPTSASNLPFMDGTGAWIIRGKEGSPGAEIRQV